MTDVNIWRWFTIDEGSQAEVASRPTVIGLPYKDRRVSEIRS